ncbi:MAG: hypothetical protein WAL26_22575 [Mycobacterium sp.]
MDTSEPSIRPTVPDELDAIGEIYAHHVRTEVAACLPAHRNRGFVDAGRLISVGFKHGRWLDTLLLQRSLNRAGR